MLIYIAEKLLHLSAETEHYTFRVVLSRSVDESESNSSVQNIKVSAFQT
jgi:hypothetical protein